MSQANKQGDWMGEKWNVKRGFIKLHIMVDSNAVFPNPK